MRNARDRIPNVASSDISPVVHTLQRKAAIGSEHGPLETEADSVAARVVGNGARDTGTPPNAPAAGHGDITTRQVPPSVERVLGNSGRSLEPPIRQDMEQRIGYDFSDVRIHDDSAAARSAQDVSASAYTVGNDIVFGANQFSPASTGGRRLLAHELTHVVQQDQRSGGAAPLLQRQPTHAKPKRGAILSAEEVAADPAREKLRKQSGQSTSVVCRSTSPGKRKNSCITTLSAGLGVQIVGEFEGGTWFQVTLPEALPGVAPNEPLFMPAAFVKEQAAAVSTPSTKPSPQTNYYDFEFSKDPAEPGKIQLQSAPVSKRSDYIDARLDYMVYGLYLRGFILYLKNLDTPVFISNRYLEDRKESISIGDRIFDTIDQAKAAVASASQSGGAPRHSYYWGAEGKVIAPTVFSIATTPRIMETLFAARAELARQVRLELAAIGIGIVGGRVLNYFYGKARRSFTDDPVPKPTTATPTPKPKADPAADPAKSVNADPNVKTTPLNKGDTDVAAAPVSAKPPASKPRKESIDVDQTKLSNKKRGGGGAKRNKGAQADEDEEFRADERQDRQRGNKKQQKKEQQKRQEEQQGGAPAGSDTNFQGQINTKVKADLNRSGQYNDIEQWELQSVQGPYKLATPDPLLKEGRGFRYQASFRKPDGTTVDVSVNYDPNGQNFGTIKEAGGKP